MTLRDLKPQTLKTLAVEGEEEYDKWFKITNGGTKFGTTDVQVGFKDVWLTAYSKGATAILRRVDAIKENG